MWRNNCKSAFADVALFVIDDDDDDDDKGKVDVEVARYFGAFDVFGC